MNSPPDTARSAMRVLVAEDDALCAMELSAMLEDMGWNVVGPIGNLSALPPAGAVADCALLDVNIGGTWSYAAAESLMDCGIPVAFVTGYAALPECPPRLAGRPMLGKPFNCVELAAVMDTLTASLAERRTA